MKSFQSFLKENEDTGSGAIKAVRNGIGIRDSFWDDFILLLNNPEAVSELFNVPVEKIGTWHEKIKSVLSKVQEDDNEMIPKDKKSILKTGLPEKI